MAQPVLVKMHNAWSFRAPVLGRRARSSRAAGAFVDYACDRKLSNDPSIEDLQYAADQVVRERGRLSLRRARALLKFGSKSGPEVDTTVIRLLESATRDGIPEAAHDLGLLLCRGNGGVVDKTQVMKAVDLFEFAAQEGMGKAAHNLGFLLSQGHGVAQDKARAAELFELAATQGVAKAAVALGNMLESGDGVRQDLAKAQRFFEVAHKAAAAKNARLQPDSE